MFSETLKRFILLHFTYQSEIVCIGISWRFKALSIIIFRKSNDVVTFKIYTKIARIQKNSHEIHVSNSAIYGIYEIVNFLFFQRFANTAPF